MIKIFSLKTGIYKCVYAYTYRVFLAHPKLISEKLKRETDINFSHDKKYYIYYYYLSRVTTLIQYYFNVLIQVISYQYIVELINNIVIMSII